jgi:hypothetical protein
MRWDDQHSLTAFNGIAALFIGGVQLSSYSQKLVTA